MTYSTLLEEEGINAQFLAILKPSRRLTSWTLDSGSIYKTSFTLGHVVDITVDGTAYTEESSSTLDQGEWFYDNDAKEIFIRLTGNDNPNTTGFIVVTYEIHIATFDAHWHRIPTDDSTINVYYQPLISKPPVILQDIKDVTFGALPVLSTSITITNAEHEFEEQLYNSSFNDKEFALYHWLDELDTDNIKLVLRGNMTNVSYSDSNITFQVFDALQELENEFRSDAVSGQTAATYTTSDFSNLQDFSADAPIPYVYGVAWVNPVNVDFELENPSTSNNRIWGVRADGASSHAITRTVPASPLSTTTRTYVDDATGFIVGDSVWIDKTTDEYREVTAVDYDNNYIEHDALVSGAAATSDTVKRGTVGRVEIEQNEKIKQAMYNRDWTESTDGTTGTLMMTFTSSVESNLSIDTFGGAEQIRARVYGKTNNVTLGGGAFGTNDSKTGNLTALPVILFDILKTFANIDESRINTSSFTSLLSDTTEAIGFSSPSAAATGFSNIKSIINDIMKTGFIKFYQDFDLKWKVTQTKPISATSKDIDEEEILDGSIRYKFNYKDIYSDIRVRYFYDSFRDKGDSVTASSDTAKFLHGVERRFNIISLHIFEDDAQLLADRLSFVYGDQQGIIELDTKNRFFDNIIDDDIKVLRTKLPGFAFDEDTEREREFSIMQVEKGLRTVRLSMSDQKGIEDNEADWNG